MKVPSSFYFFILYGLRGTITMYRWHRRRDTDEVGKHKTVDKGALGRDFKVQRKDARYDDRENVGGKVHMDKGNENESET